MSKRTVFGRIKQEVAGGNYTFALTKAGIVVHQARKRIKTDITLSFETLQKMFAKGQMMANLVDGEIQVNGGEFLFTANSEGITVRRPCDKMTRTEPWAEIANRSRVQPLLFPEVDAGPEPDKRPREIDINPTPLPNKL